MRVVDVHTTGDRPIDLVLHPRLTVLSGLSADCSTLAEALARVFVLAGTDVTGSVEYSGFHMPLDQTTVVSLDLPGEGFRVVTAADIPSPDSSAHERRLADLRTRRKGWEERHWSTSARVDELRRHRDATAAAVEVGRQELEDARTAHAELTRRAGELADAPGILEEKLAVAREQQRGAAEASAAMTALAPALIETFHSGSESIRALRLGVDPTHPRELVARAADVALLSQQRCEDLENWLAAIAAGSAPADPSLAEMMADVRMVEQRWQELGKVGVEDEPDVVEARHRHDQLMNRLGALEELAGSGILADRARAEIDAAHRERAEAEDERRFRSGALDAAIENEHRVVGLYGFDSYLEYTIAVSTRSVGEAVEATLERVRAESVSAADALEAVRASAAAARATIAEERAKLRDRIRTQTGVDADELTVDVLAQVPELPGSLEGIESEVESRLAWAAREAARCTARVEELERERDQSVDPVPGLLSEAEASLRRAVALEPLVERATEDHRSVQREIEETERLVAEAAQQLAAIDADIESAATSGDQGYTLGDVTSIVGAMTPSIDQPGPDPIPVLMIDAFGPLAAMATNALEATMAAAVRVQLVYVTDDPVVIDWADRLSSSAGQLVRLGRPSWFQRRLARRQTRRMSHQQ